MFNNELKEPPLTMKITVSAIQFLHPHRNRFRNNQQWHAAGQPL